MRVLIISFLITLLVGCTIGDSNDSVVTAQPYVGLEERLHRKQIKELVGVDPVRTEWCAAFVNAVLELDNIPGSDTVSNKPLLARSFLQWGEHVERYDVQRGDVVVFPRGSVSWQGHVGFYVERHIVDGIEYWVILGGNQDKKVSYVYYKPNKAIGIRRYHKYQ